MIKKRANQFFQLFPKKLPNDKIQKNYKINFSGLNFNEKLKFSIKNDCLFCF